MEDPRRRVPRTDAVLADPAVARGRGAARPGRRVKAAVADALDRCRRGERRAGRGRRRASSPRCRPPGRRLRAGRQRHRRRRAHQPRPRAAVAGRRRGVVTAAGTTDVELDLATGRRGPRGAGAARRPARRPCPRPAASTWSTTARPRWRWSPRALAAGARGRGRARRAGRDRRRLPHPRAPRVASARGCARSGRPTASPSRTTRGAIDERHRLRAQGAPLELRGRGLHRRAVPVAASWPASAAPVVADIGSGLLRPHPRLPDEPDAAAALRAGRRPRHGLRRQAARRPAVRAGARRRRPGRAAAPAPARAGAARRQADPGRPRGDARRAADRRSPRALDADPSSCLRAGPCGWRRAHRRAPRPTPSVDGPRSAAEGRRAWAGQRRRRAAGRARRAAAARRPAGRRPRPPTAGCLLDLLTVPDDRDDDARRRGAAGPAET